MSDVILFDRFSTTKEKVLKHSTTKECTLCLCMLDREGRTFFFSTAVALYNIIYNSCGNGVDSCVSDRILLLSDWFP